MLGMRARKLSCGPRSAPPSAQALCVCVCVCACVRASERACVRACVRLGLGHERAIQECLGRWPRGVGLARLAAKSLNPEREVAPLM